MKNMNIYGLSGQEEYLAIKSMFSSDELIHDGICPECLGNLDYHQEVSDDYYIVEFYCKNCGFRK